MWTWFTVIGVRLTFKLALITEFQLELIYFTLIKNFIIIIIEFARRAFFRVWCDIEVSNTDRR